jgi:hypothetical protein
VLYQVTDARLLARATAWAGLAESARNQDFNITNGDTFRWRHMFPRIADYFGIAQAPAQQLRLTDHMPSQERDWDEIASLHRLEPTRAGVGGAARGHVGKSVRIPVSLAERSHSSRASVTGCPGLLVDLRVAADAPEAVRSDVAGARHVLWRLVYGTGITAFPGALLAVRRSVAGHVIGITAVGGADWATSSALPT